MLRDTLMRDSSVGVFITESWLNNEILDAAVFMEDFTLFRGDRCGRNRGGAALYLKDNLNGRLLKSFSNGVVDFVMVTSKSP